MPTLRIKIVNGEFAETNMPCIRWTGKRCLTGNGWRCIIKDDGTVVCDANQKCYDGIHTMRYRITTAGHETLTLRVPGKEEKIIKDGYATKRGVLFTSGVIGLSSGFVDERYAYFRTMEYQEFLDEHGITAIKRGDPNTMFPMIEEISDETEMVTYFFTDGRRRPLGNETSIKTVTIGNKTGAVTTFKQKWKVSGATWVMYYKTITDRETGEKREQSAYLYTLEKDVTTLKRLPVAKK